MNFDAASRYIFSEQNNWRYFFFLSTAKIDDDFCVEPLRSVVCCCGAWMMKNKQNVPKTEKCFFGIGRESRWFLIGLLLDGQHRRVPCWKALNWILIEIRSRALFAVSREALKEKSNIDSDPISAWAYIDCVCWLSQFECRQPPPRVRSFPFFKSFLYIFGAIKLEFRNEWGRRCEVFVDFNNQYLHFHFIYLFPMPENDHSRCGKRWRRGRETSMKIIKKRRQNRATDERWILINEFFSSPSTCFDIDLSRSDIVALYVYFSLDPDFQSIVCFPFFSFSVYLSKKFVKSNIILSMNTQTKFCLVRFRCRH